ncbi:hypothetical protein FEF09_29335 [Chitinophaga pinensis]|uniref:Uncharacterized protein n=1 Tax=Chitinophaga pinensis TaxID=79329 RepID=A0A5C6LI32_9BACT|nr:hypothetical protein FEF09_29335 [Chitinophaga pinensis]
MVLFLLTGIGLSANCQVQQHSYPRITGYVGVLHPIVTFGDGGAHYNFDGAYVGGLPTGINIWKSSAIGFSMEIVPFIRAAEGSSKMNNLLFHPGLLVSLGHGFTLATRAAFETSGRYGLTPVLNKIIRKNKTHSYFIALPIPARFGNDRPSTVGIGFQFGISF